MMLRRPVDPDRGLNNLLYADLKLRRLLKEYADLQRQAQDLLKGLGDGTGSKRNASFSEKDIHRLQMELRRQLRLLPNGFPLIAEISNPLGIGTIGLGGSQVPWADLNKEAPGGVESELTWTAQPYSSARTYNRKDIAKAGPKTPISAIFRALLIATAYLMAHKNEVLICTILLIVLVNGLSVFLKHR
jgi:hypothetical protein